MISEGSCDTKDKWCMAAENSASAIIGINSILQYTKLENIYFKL